MNQIAFGPSIMGSWDTIEFDNSEDPGTVALKVDVHFAKSGNGVRLLELTNSTKGIDDPKRWHTNPSLGSNKMFNGPNGNFTIQIWEDENTGICLINIFSQSPNSALFKFHTTFRYDSTWFRVSDANIIYINREVSSTVMDRMLKIDEISQCRFPVPCDQQPELIPVDLRLPYSLSCKVSGVEYLSYKWWKADTELILSAAELVIPACSVDDLGLYTCQVFGENYGKIAEKMFSLQYSKEINVLSRDLERNPIIWVEGWPLDEVELRCLSEAGEVLPFYRGNVSHDHVPPRVKLTATNPKNTSDINCDVINKNGSTVLATYENINPREGQSPKDYYKISTCIVSVLLTICVPSIAFLAIRNRQSRNVRRSRVPSTETV